jgi:hypothetical protein
MGRVILRVPFTEREHAKRLGARWDMGQKMWYVPEGVDATPLKQWLPVAWEPNIRAPYCFLALSTRHWWRCEGQTSVHAIILPRGHEILYVGDDPADDHWQESGEATALSYIYELQEPVPTRLRMLATLQSCLQPNDPSVLRQRRSICTQSANPSLPAVAATPAMSRYLV